MQDKNDGKGDEAPARERGIYKVTLVGSIVNLVLLVFKFVAGVLGRSSAMIADAVHSLSDFISDIIVIVFVRVSSRPDDNDHDYGHGKFETLASLIVGLILACVGIGLLVEGASKVIFWLRGGVLEHPGMIALIAAILSIGLKEGLFHYTMAREKKLNSPALVANAWHHRSDAMTSVATLVGIGGAMLLGNRWSVLDPMAAVIVSFFIIGAAYKLMKPNLDQLLEKSLTAHEKEEITEIILSTPGVRDMHHLRTRRIGVAKSVECHIKLNGDMPLREAHDIATRVEQNLRAAIGKDTHISLHMEPARK